MKEDEKKDGVTLEDFIIPQKIVAFKNYYRPVEKESLATSVFTDATLRQFFKAWPCTLGDPLRIYLQRLENLGFKMRVSISGEPAIFVEERV